MFHWLVNLFHRPETSQKEKIISSVVSFVYIFGLGFLSPNLNAQSRPFYDALVKSSLTPPGWIFPIVWTALFFLIGLSGYLVWNHYIEDWLRKGFAALYFINGILVYLWSFFFFGRQSAASALFVIVALLIVIEMLILTAFKSNPKAAYCLIPYLLWVLFATYLNTAILALNG